MGVSILGSMCDGSEGVLPLKTPTGEIEALTHGSGGVDPGSVAALSCLSYRPTDRRDTRPRLYQIASARLAARLRSLPSALDLVASVARLLLNW